ncbi:hypothetical protein JZO80_02975 [Vagococcus fluvialis]|uniref:hypothetical protein n=1 Tax=Vagococcus fluvialis TaxID=2738 RepID=UPI000A34B2D9|nr:hypothetical protein [Vagococcus fluvialis]MBO0419112.1 hypothetical protein [Vagococcus fluvialis]OTP29537.1 hypothetical protein A5798_002705 [Enterococcus sp. 6C8_DIV0013]
MLKTKQSTSFTGEISIEGTVTVTLQANITKQNSGNTYINQSIINQDLYNSNREICRKEISDFKDKVYQIEDKFIEEGDKAAE